MVLSKRNQAEMLLPDGAHDPRDLAVALADGELQQQGDLPHQGPEVDALVHPLEGAVLQVLDSASRILLSWRRIGAAADRIARGR